MNKPQPAFKKATSKEKKGFARRFNFERWMNLCGDSRFADAFEKGDLETCRNIADGLA